MWQKDTFDPATIDQELTLAQGIGFNSARVFVQYIVWEDDRTGLKDRREEALKDRRTGTVLPPDVRMRRRAPLARIPIRFRASSLIRFSAPVLTALATESGATTCPRPSVLAKT